MSTKRPGPAKILYSLIGIAILLYSGHLVWTLVMHIWHQVPYEKTIKTGPDNLFKQMVGGETKLSAYKDINTVARLYDFHQTDQKAVLDKHNLCISCHGDLPHNHKQKTRAFLNMHAFFMACETCHIRLEGGSAKMFIWYDKTTGTPHENMNLEHFLGNTPYKLMPVENDGARIYDNEQMIAYVSKFKANVDKMDPLKKKTDLEVIHNPMTEVKNTVTCKECHTFDRNKGYLSFIQIGYPPRRADQLAGNEVVGMIYNYKKFYLPHMLTPNKEDSSEK